MSSKKPRSPKMGKAMIAVCSAAIGTIYLSAYWVTASQDSVNAAAFTKSAPLAALQTLPPVVSPSPSTAAPASPTVKTDPSRSPQTASPTPSDSSRGSDSMQPASPTKTPTQAQSAAPKSEGGVSATAAYKDGTYSGSGTNRFGTVEVAVTIKNNKIASVEITRCATRYPQRVIDKLPSQVLEKQSGEVDVVSGATRSTEDFQNAVRAALAKAKA